MPRFIQSTIVMKMKQDDNQVIEQKVEAMVAEGVGLAYVQEEDRDGEEIGYSLTHVFSGSSVCSNWLATDEQEARAWIERLDLYIDWTRDTPRVRSGMAGKIFDFVAVGALHEISEEREQEEKELQ